MLIYTLFEFLYSLEEALNFSQGADQSLGDVVFSYSTVAILFTVFYLLFAVALFVLKGVGIYTIAKREKIVKPYLAFIPFAEWYLLGKIVGKVRVFGKDTNKLGLFVMLSKIVYFIFTGASEILIYAEPLKQLFVNNVLISPQESISVLEAIFTSAQAVFAIIYFILSVFLIIVFFKYYAGRNATLYSFLSVFFEVLFPIFVFVIRNNPKSYINIGVNYGPYNSNYGNGPTRNGFSDTPHGEEDDPFAEYKEKNTGNEGYSNSGEKSDVFSEYPDFNNDKNNNDDGDLF